MAEKTERPDDVRFNWIGDTIRASFPQIAENKFPKMFITGINVQTIMAFLNTPDQFSLCVCGDLTFTISKLIPKKISPRLHYIIFLKHRNGKITPEAYKQEISVLEMQGDSLEFIGTCLREIYIPLLQNIKNHEGWGEVAVKEIIEKLHSFLSSVSIMGGEKEGHPCLPLPPSNILDSSNPASNKDIIHLLESSIVIWSKQIKTILSQDPESQMKKGQHPTPEVELEFWRNKNNNLNTIYKQLESDNIKKVLIILDQAKSTYCTPFMKLIKEVAAAREETNDNVKFLRPLEPWLTKLAKPADFPELASYFRPTMCTILKIWQRSQYYNTPSRLIVLMREICNGLIEQARVYISGADIFKFIEDEEAGTAIMKLKNIIKLCATFEQVFHDYKASALSECPDNPWNISNNAIFLRLDSFLERCNDILDLTQTILLFSKLSRIEIGGTKGKTLTTSILQIHSDFEAAVETIKGVPYDIMDVGVKQFDDDFYEFQCHIKELERRLASVLTQGFDDCPTLSGRFKLFDSFEGIIERPIVMDELEKKYLDLIQSFHKDVKTVQELFLTERDDPPISNNLPPVAGAISWCEALLERIQGPMDSLQTLNRGILEREEVKEVTKIYEVVVDSLKEYRKDKLLAWCADVDQTSQSKLKLPLLKRSEDKTLQVNFDPELVRLLREVKYFLLLKEDVPKEALSVYRKNETFRIQRSNLDIIVDMYNRIVKELIPVEEPLIHSHMEKVESTIKKGIDSMSWQSSGIDSFISECKSVVGKAYEVLFTLKGNLDKIQKLLKEWAEKPMIERHSKPVTPEDFDESYTILINKKYEIIKKNGVDIHNLLKDSSKTVQGKCEPEDWKNYVEYCNTIVTDGLVNVTMVSLQFIYDQLDLENIQKMDKLPMLEIELDLRAPDAVYIPSTEEGKGPSVKDIVNKWIEDMINIGTLFKQLESTGDYADSIRNNETVKNMLEKIITTIDSTNQKCEDYKQEFVQFDYLWLQDQDKEFEKFLHDATDEAYGTKVPLFEKFDTEITKYSQIRDTITHLTSPTDIGWLRVNSLPIKQALITCVTRWIYLYTRYLESYVLDTLNNLETFINNVNNGLAQEVNEGDKETLRSVMGSIRDVRARDEQTKACFDPLRDAVNLLKKHNINLEGQMIDSKDVVTYLDEAPVKWQNTVNGSYKKKEEIMPYQNAEVDNIRKDTDDFYDEIREFQAEFKKNAPYGYKGPVDDAYARMQEYATTLVSLQERSKQFALLEDLFELNAHNYKEIDDVMTELIQLKNLWDFKDMIQFMFDEWEQSKWTEINTDDLGDRTRELLGKCRQLSARNPIIKAWQVYKDIEDMVKNMSVVLPLIQSLHSPAMQDRHWIQLATICKVEPIQHKDENFNLKDVLALGLHLHVDDVVELVDCANKEQKIEGKLLNIEKAWVSLIVQFEQHNDSDVMVIRVPDEVVETLEAHQLELQSMISMGRFADYFRETIDKWQRTLGTVETVLKNWMSVTQQWSSLESIYLLSEDIAQQLPDDTAAFKEIDVKYKAMMVEAVKTPNVIEICTYEGRSDLLEKDMLPVLEKCQKSLTEYLDTKKKIYPRFYFVSNVALLDMLSNGNIPKKIMKHLGDCYAAIDNLRFVGDSDFDTEAMNAKDGEVVDFPHPFHIQGNVECWLNDLTDVMIETLQCNIDQCIQAGSLWSSEKPRDQWLFEFPAQSVLAGAETYWTEETERALSEFENGSEDAVKEYVKVCTARLECLIKLVQGQLTAADRVKIIALITMDVHNRDVVQKLVTLKAEGPASFQWQQQLRFYYLPDPKKLMIKITDYVTEYSFEYVGNLERLVVTPLTDRCYITLTLALRLMLGGAPAGPAGTGKTETTKDLARALARPIYVFNCSDQMNYQTMADIFKGLSQTGAWGCFDEFNRIAIEVLSVVASQVKQCLGASVHLSNPANREPEFKNASIIAPNVVGYFHLDGDRIRLIPTTGFFITMNPGYAGRTELPENVKALFRPCAMVKPDFQPICENMLMAEGFVTARVLSIKFVTLYSLSSELLSKQHHYDWGLRSIKAVLRVAGGMKRANPDMGEEAVLMRALRDFNTPKMPVADLPIFLRLIQDLFPESYKLPVKYDEVLQKKAIEVCENTGLQPEHTFVMKVIQYQELLNVRHSVFIIGPAGCGKTATWKTLLGTHNLNKEKPVAIAKVLNPKAVTSNELYGYMTMTKEWKDGVISIIMRGMSKNMKELGYHAYQTVKWVVLDGDIDAVWIESMNTVMDDNKVLTLVSNERVPLTEAMRMIFEINTLKNASPATVSRAGILFINETDIGWRPMMESWVATRPKMEQEILPLLFEKYVDTIVDNMKSQIKTIIPLRIINKISTICNLMEGFMQEIKEKDKELIELYFIQATIWAFGGATSNEKLNNYRKNFSDIWRMSFTDKYQFPTEPAHSIVLDFYLDPEQRQWIHWSTKVDAYEHQVIGRNPGETMFFNIGVKTIDTVRLQYLFRTLTKNGHGAMLVGPAGTGKTKVIKDFLNNTDETFSFSCINMNFYTDHAACQALLEQKIDKRSGTRYGPPPGKKMIYFIDDMNMPQVETYGSQGALALLTLVIDHGILYDRQDPSLKKTIEDILVMGAMNPTAGSFTICERLQRHFDTFSMDMPTVTDCNTIYSSILKGHLADFPKGIIKLADPIINATLSLHEKVLNKFLPSAIKFVYNWNMREYSNIIQGLCNTSHELYTEPIQMLRLWVHEAFRVFSDRLINEKDIEKFKEMLIEVIKQVFEENHISTSDKLLEEPLIYTSFHSPQMSYLPIPTGQEGEDLLSNVLIAKLNEYNESNSIMDLVLFKEAMEHVTRITRILSLTCGHALLVGVGGSGKQSLAKLASFICGHEVKQLSISSSFGISDLLESLKEFYMLAGVKNTSLVWIVTDSHIVDDHFLVFINDVLSAGYVPNLFSKDEIEGIFQSLRGPAKAAGISSDPVSMMDFFIQKVQANLHLVLCFSPVGDTLRVRARRFPGIINCTVIDWFHEWPKHALISVANKFLAEVDLGGDEVRDNIANHIAGVHVSVIEKSLVFAQKLKRYNYVTPRSFLEMIAFYKTLLAEKREEMRKQIERLSVGLATLQKTAADVAILKEDLTRTMVVVEEKKQATTVLLEEMGSQKAEAEKQQAAANVEAEKANAASKIAAEIEEQASSELAEAKPAMDAAANAVDCLDKNSLTELKNFTNPPQGVDLVTNACLMMLRSDFKNLSWDKAKKMMKDVGVFMKELKEYPAEEMTENLIKNLTPIVQNTIFTPENMKNKSSAAANLCEWVANIYKYNRIYVKVKPLMDRLEVAKADKAKAEADLAAAMELVATVEAKLKELQDKYQTALEEKNKVEEEAAACQKRLGLAERLVNGLSSENTRWGLEVEKLKQNEVNIIGDTLLSAAFASYVGGFDASFRTELWKDNWLADLNQREIPTSDGLDPLHILTNDGAIAIMESQGLPADRMSIENGCICNAAKRWPLLIDPQLQGIKWLRGKYPEATCLQFSMKNWQKRLQSDIQMGRTVILENVQEEIDHTLDPLLARAVYLKGKTLYLRFCGEEIEFAKDFRLILQCRLSNPHYQPEIQAQCTLINFIATERGLEDQLLAKVVNEEKPELEKEKQDLQKKLNDYKIKLIDLEDTLLDKLSHAPADILSDEPLIIALEDTKKTAGEIQEAVVKAKETEIEININRDAYRKVACEGAMLYFMLTTLCTIDHMYQYSLDAFTTFFYKAIHKTPPQEKQEDRVEALRSVLRLTIYTWISRGLYEEHKLIVMTLLTFNLMQRKVIEVEYTQQQMIFLKRAPTKIGEDNQLAWLSAGAWNTVQALAEIDEYRRLPNDMIEASGRFQEWFTSPAPEDEKLPLDWSALDKTFFQKMLVVRALRPDRMTAALNHFIRITLPQGDDFADCDATYSSLQILEQCLADSNNVTPIYFILSPGTDVAADVDKLAIKNGMVINETYHSVSMGQGQDGIAMNRLEVAHKEGHWVILHNVHLMPRWLVELEKKLDEFALEGSHDNFRLFLTSDPSNTIPIGILNRCIKLTNEPPTGLKANLKRAFCSISREGYDETEGKVKCITFALCHFHAVLIERKKFGPKGFNMIYPFNLGDLRDSRSCLLNYMSENSSGNNIPWDDLRYIFGQIMYGGHIVNDLDRVLCMTYLDLFMRDEILDEAELLPFCEQEKLSFKMPLPTTYDKYIQHINDNVKFETPLAYGLHPNAEIDFKTTVSNNLFKQLQNLESQGGDAGDGESAQTEAEGVLQDIMEKFGETYFNLEELPIEEKGPYQNVFLQECEHINFLLDEVRRSLNELSMGFAGELTMSEQMDKLFKDLYLGKIPESWSNLAWPSMRSLPSWIKNLEKRIEQFRNWCGSPMEIPVVTWISGFANPQSFLTAILQQTAQKSGQALDCLVTQTEVTKYENYAEIEERSREGAFIHGLFLEGARWDTQSMIIDKSLPREMFCSMPVICVKAVAADKAEQNGIYQCPVFRTEQRGPTFVCFAQLRTKSPAARWVLAGAAMIMDIVE